MNRLVVLVGVLSLGCSLGGVGLPVALAAGPFVRVLGIAQDGGLPHAACRCPRCEAARERPDRASGVASLALVAPAAQKVYLVDAAPEITSQLALLHRERNAPVGSVDRAPLDGVFLTHAHMGHYLGLAWLGFEAVSTRGVPVWASQRMGKFLRSNGPWDQLVSQGNIELRVLEPGQPVSLPDGLSVTAIPVPHRDEYSDTMAYLVAGPKRRLLYVPDTSPWRAWKRPLEAHLEGVDVALLDGTFFSGDELPGRDLSRIGHPLMVDTMKRLQALVDARKLEVWFIHLNHSNPALDPRSPARQTLEGRGFHVAQPGQDLAL